MREESSNKHMITRKTTTKRIYLIAAVFLACAAQVSAQQPERDVSKEPARQTRNWVRDGVIYEIYPRAFSSPGNFSGITARLDNLKDLGVTILWLMVDGAVHTTCSQHPKRPKS